MKWDKLSMRDRAFLIREAVRNGVTDIGSIRDTWEHRFDGENSHLTEDEYIAYKADSVRQAALNRARNRNTLEAPIIGYEKVSPEAVRSVLEEVFNKEREIQIARQKAMVLGDYGNARSQYEQLIKDRDYWQERYKELQQYSAGKGRPIIGDNCIYTVSGDFGRPVSGNCTFRERHSELGFKEIPFKETSPGDIVQFRSFTGDPVHAMMANTPYNEDTSKMRYNGSSGGTSDKHLRINSSYPIDGTPTPWVYEYVGNRADSLQWKKEYNEKYGHKFSGTETHNGDKKLVVKDANQRLERVENNKARKGSGWDAAQRVWRPHPSWEGGATTIGYGLKLMPGTDVYTLVDKQGFITEEQEISLRKREVEDRYDEAKKTYDNIYGIDSFNDLGIKTQSLLVDKEYNVRGGVKTYPKLMNAAYRGDLQGMRDNIKVSGRDKKTGELISLGRNDDFKKDLDSIAMGYYTLKKRQKKK